MLIGLAFTLKNYGVDFLEMKETNRYCRSSEVEGKIENARNRIYVKQENEEGKYKF